MKFLDVRTDFAFKKVFGSEDSKPRLISFLNATLAINHEVTDLDILDPYNIPQLKGMKDTFVDVKAILSDGSKVIIEMQILGHPGIEKRILYNAAKNYSTQLVKGQRYDLLKPVIALTIANFEMFPESDEMINHFKVLNKKDFSTYSHDIELTFIELKKFNKEQEDCNGIQDDWIYFLKNAGDLTMIPKDLPAPVQAAYEVSNEAGMTMEELDLQHSKEQYMAIQMGSISQAEIKGHEEGLEQGLEQGEQRGNIKTTKKMIKGGFDNDTIHQMTGLSHEDIEALRLEMKKDDSE